MSDPWKDYSLEGREEKRDSAFARVFSFLVITVICGVAGGVSFAFYYVLLGRSGTMHYDLAMRDTIPNFTMRLVFGAATGALVGAICACKIDRTVYGKKKRR